MSQAGRKPITTVMPEKTPIDHDDIEQKMNALQVQGRQELETQENARALAKQLGYEGSLQPDVLEEGVRQSQRRVEIEVFAIGAGLLLLKEQCPHGEFAERCERLGVEDRLARRLMRSALKFSNRATSPDLAKLGKSKLFELVVLDDEEAEQFADGQSVRGITYDDAARMTVSELRQALREANERIAAKDRVAADNQAAMQRLQEQIHLRQREAKAPEESPAQEQLDAVDAQTREIATLIIAPLRSVFVRLAQVLSPDDPIYRQVIGASVGRILAVTRKVAADFEIPVSGPESVDAEAPWDEIWAMTLRDVEAAQAKGATPDDGDVIEA